MQILPINRDRSRQPRAATPNPAADDCLAIGAPLQIRWEERKGVQRQMRVLIMDVQKSALWVKSQRGIVAGTLVNLYTDEFVPIGRASIRECTTRAMDYSIGLYLPGRSTPDL